MPAQTGPKRTRFQIERDRQHIADWYLQGLTQAVIAERINADPEREYTLTQQTISNDIRRLQELWLASSVRDFNEMKAQELAKIDRLEREYWRGWESSQEDAETKIQKTKGNIRKIIDPEAEEVDGEPASFIAERPAEMTKTAKGQVGDPRFLAGVERCIERRCKILGIDAPTEFKHSGQVTTIMRVAGFDDV